MDCQLVLCSADSTMPLGPSTTGSLLEEPLVRVRNAGNCWLPTDTRRPRLSSCAGATRQRNVRSRRTSTLRRCVAKAAWNAKET